MLLLYMTLQLITVLLLLLNMDDEYIIYHIEPYNEFLKQYIDDTMIEYFKGYYQTMISIPLIKQELYNIFGPDIGDLLFEYIPFTDDDEMKSLVQRNEELYKTKWKGYYANNSIIYAAFHRG